MDNDKDIKNFLSKSIEDALNYLVEYNSSRKFTNPQTHIIDLIIFEEVAIKTRKAFTETLKQFDDEASNFMSAEVEAELRNQIRKNIQVEAMVVKQVKKK